MSNANQTNQGSTNGTGNSNTGNCCSGFEAIARFFQQLCCCGTSDTDQAKMTKNFGCCGPDKTQEGGADSGKGA